MRPLCSSLIAGLGSLALASVIGATTVNVDYVKIDIPTGNNLIHGACARISPGGLPQHTEQLVGHAWNSGPNGIRQSGGGDDLELFGSTINWIVLGSTPDSVYDAYSGRYSLTDSPGGDYIDNRNVAAEITQTFNLTGESSAQIKFRHHYETESGFDRCYVEMKKNNVWTALATYEGTLGAPGVFSPVTINVPASYLGSQVKVRFRFSSDGSVIRDGWHVDDAEFWISGAQVYFDDFETGTDGWTLQSPWGLELPYVPEVLGSVDASGLFTAGGKTGTAYVIASSVGAVSDTIDVKVVPPDWVAGP